MPRSLHRVLEYDKWNYYHLKHFLKRNASSINDLDHELGVTPLHRVLMNDKCSLNIVTLLLQYGADVNLVSRISSALFIALMYHKNKDIIRVLLEAGADVNAIDEYYILPPLGMALRWGAPAEIIELLLNFGCPIENSGDYASMLHCAAYHELKADVCHLLLQAGAGDVNLLDRYGESVLCYALRKGTELGAFRMLLGAGCSLTSCTAHQSAWLCATSYSSMLRRDILRVLVETGIDISPVNELNETVLQCALRYCVYETDAIELLLNLQVGRVATSEMDKSLLLDATSNYACKLSTVKLLIKRKVSLDVADTVGDTPLHNLLQYNSCSPDIIKYLLEKGVPVNKKNNRGDTPLRIAVEKAHKMSIIELLLKGGARIYMPNDFKFPMLRLLLTRYHLNPFQEEHQYLVMLFLKYTFLEFINFEIEGIDSEIHLDYDIFSGFANACVSELESMKLKKVGYFCTLYDVINREIESPMDIDVPDYENAEIFDFNRLLKILRNNRYPVYFDVISNRIGKEVMLDNLSKIKVCADDVILNEDCVRCIGEFLSESDVLRMMVAFFVRKLSLRLTA